MWLAWLDGMGLATATIEMQSPEEHRERLHELLKATRTVMVLSAGCDGGERIVGQPMALLRTGDDTTMYVAAALDARQVAELTRERQVTVVVHGACYALFEGEATITRDGTLSEESQGRMDAASAVLVVSPIAGAYWDGANRYSYLYRLWPRPDASDVSNGVPVGI